MYWVKIDVETVNGPSGSIYAKTLVIFCIGVGGIIREVYLMHVATLVACSLYFRHLFSVQLVIHEIPVSWILDLQEGQVLFTWFESVILSVSLERNLSFLISKLYLDSFPPYRQLTFQGRRKMTNITAFNCFQLKS
ncbi:unnamed protein product [Heterobilharzia americana]|nr:unnamed protein product [Heterobilharzia americana]